MRYRYLLVPGLFVLMGAVVGPHKVNEVQCFPSTDTAVNSGITPTEPCDIYSDFDAGGTGTLTCMGADADELLWQMRCDDGDNAFLHWNCTTNTLTVNASGGTLALPGTVTGIGFEDIAAGTNANALVVSGSLTTTGAGTINATSVEGTDTGTLTDGQFCTYDLANTEIDCASSAATIAYQATEPTPTCASAPKLWIDSDNPEALYVLLETASAGTCAYYSMGSAW